MTLEALAENYRYCLIKDFERQPAAGVDIFYFCYQKGIAFHDLQPFVAGLKSEGSVVETNFGVYMMTSSGYAMYKRRADKTWLRRLLSIAEAAVRRGLTWSD